jgi:hypothetical protein
MGLSLMQRSASRNSSGIAEFGSIRLPIQFDREEWMQLIGPTLKFPTGFSEHNRHDQIQE